MTVREFTDQEVIENLQYLTVKMAGELEEVCQALEECQAENTDLAEKVVELESAKSNAKVLNADTARHIRKQYRNGVWSQRELAALYDINPVTVNRIVRGIYYPGV